MARAFNMGVGDFSTTPLLLERKLHKHNILIGFDKMQVRWAEQFLSAAHDFKVRHELVPTVTDDMVHNPEPKLYVVEQSSHIDLAPQVKSKVGIWSLDLIEPGSGGLNAIVRAGAHMMGIMKPEKKDVDAIASQMEEVYDVRASIWHAAWLWTEPKRGKRARWMRPWENWLLWLPVDEDARFRLNSLYWELVQWTFAQTGDERGYKKVRGEKGKWDLKKWQKLQSLLLPKDKVYKTLVELSSWKKHKYDPYLCVIKIAKIWEAR
jgi:hypothetical protein